MRRSQTATARAISIPRAGCLSPGRPRGAWGCFGSRTPGCAQGDGACGAPGSARQRSFPRERHEHLDGPRHHYVQDKPRTQAPRVFIPFAARPVRAKRALSILETIFRETQRMTSVRRRSSGRTWRATEGGNDFWRHGRRGRGRRACRRRWMVRTLYDASSRPLVRFTAPGAFERGGPVFSWRRSADHPRGEDL